MGSGGEVFKFTFQLAYFSHSRYLHGHTWRFRSNLWNWHQLILKFVWIFWFLLSISDTRCTSSTVSRKIIKVLGFHTILTGSSLPKDDSYLINASVHSHTPSVVDRILRWRLMILIVALLLEYETCECDGVSFPLLDYDKQHSWLGNYPEWACPNQVST